MGNISGFHGQYFDISGISDSTMMSNRASEVIAEALRLPAPKSSSHGHPGRARLVAFLDLDATLFDYSKVRIDATAAALRGMVSNPEGIGHDLFELLRYSLTDLLVNLGFHDLRRTWDSPEVLLFACMLDSEFSRAALVALSELSQESVSSEDDVSLAHRILSFQRARKIRREARAVFDSVAELRLRWNSQLADRSRVFREYVESSANLAPGARELITQLKDARAELHVVSEGDSAIQRFKFNSLGLAELFQTCVVTDVTCGVLSILDELFQLFKDTEIQQVPSFVIELYDVLAPYTIKSPAFFSKLLHSIVDTSPGTLQQRVQSPRFLTPQEWQNAPGRSIVMIGDRYRKDLEPLLRTCTIGVQTFRVVTGRYYREDPLHEILDQGRPAPTGFFPDLKSLRLPLAAALRDLDESIPRTVPVLPNPETIDSALERCPSLSEGGRTELLKIRSEALRQQEA
jgi:phosphoglycolate phosphatase-like HAD superfamily hydrolase